MKSLRQLLAIMVFVGVVSMFGHASSGRHLVQRKQYPSDEAVGWGSSGDYLAVCYGDGSIAVWGLHSGEKVGSWSPKLKEGNIASELAFSPTDGTKFCVLITRLDAHSQRGSQIMVFSAKGGRLERTIEIPARYTVSYGFETAGERFFCEALPGGQLFRANTNTGEIEWRMSGDWLTSAGGQLLGPWSVADDGIVYARDAKLVSLSSLNKELWERKLPISADWRIWARPYASCSVLTIVDDVGGTVLALDKSSGKVLWRDTLSDVGQPAAVAPDGKSEVIAVNDQFILRDIPKNHKATLPITAAQDCQFSSDGRYIISLPSLAGQPRAASPTTMPFQRSAEKASVMDAISGKLISEVDVQKPKP